MSGTIIPGNTLSLEPINRQTIPYGDRPFVRLQNGEGVLTMAAYQFLVRLLQGVTATIGNVGTIFDVTNTIVADLSAIESEIGTIDAEIAALEQQLTAGIADVPPALPIAQGQGVDVSPLPPSFNFVFGELAETLADARACAYWGL